MKKKVLFLLAISSLFGADFPNGLCSQVVDKQVISICYDYNVKGAKYVKYTIDGKNVNQVNIKKRPRFYDEKTIPMRYRTKYADYTYAIGSEDCGGNFDANTKMNLEDCKISYDRGHLAPDADFDYDVKVLRKVYTMANIIPQVSIVNQKTWTKVERYERQVASKLGTLNVVTGVEYSNLKNHLVKKPLSLIKNHHKWKKNKIYKYYKQAKALDKKNIIIPTAFWKHYTGPNGFEKCFYYKNEMVDYKQDTLRTHQVDCSEISNLL